MTAAPENVDEQMIEQLFMFDEDGDDSFSTDMIKIFKEQAKETLKRLETGLCQGDHYDMARAGHFLKGSSVTMGSRVVPLLCSQIESAPMLTGPAQIAALSDAVDTFIDYLQTRQKTTK